jgi:murein DD-endopeptidase MepM/ murein hydrolase activator NlpD
MTRNSLFITSLLLVLATAVLSNCQVQPTIIKPVSITPSQTVSYHLDTILLAQSQQPNLATVSGNSSSNRMVISDTPTQPALISTSSPSASPDHQTHPTPASGSVTHLPATPTQSFTIYYAQSGDDLKVVAQHFGVDPGEITSPDPLPREGLLTPGQVLLLPARFSGYKPAIRLLPDSEVVYSPSAADFDVAAYLNHTNGFLKTHREYLKSTGWTTAANILTRIALENSINPRLLLALLEYHCHCVLGQPDKDVQIDFLLGNTDFRRKGLYRQLSWAASRLSAGYYGWRGGTLGEFTTPTGLVIRPAADLNAGSVAVLYFYAFYKDNRILSQAQDIEIGLPAVHTRMFGDPWQRAASVEPLFPAGSAQPPLILPFEPGRLWSFTSGPHTVWENEGAQAALDFAPATYASGCIQSDAWVVAVGDGLVVRSEFGAVIQDLDVTASAPADGLEQTGWVILYMHIESRDRVAPGTRLKAGDRIGHPSCEGGRATGTHVHMARKFNGEWVLAVGAMPFDLEGWVVFAGEKPYEGVLKRGNQTVIAHPYGSFETKIIRPTLTPTPGGG